LHSGGLDLGGGQVQLALLLLVAFAGLLLAVAVAVFAVVVVPGLRARRLAKVVGPGQATQAKRGDGGSQKG